MRTGVVAFCLCLLASGAPELLGRVPTYIIHSRRDRVVPFEPAAGNAVALERLPAR